MEGVTKTMAEFFASNAIWVSWIIFGLIFFTFLVMAPCHAVLLLPFAGLPLFWLLPLGYALPINGGIWLATPFLYRLIRRSMRKPPLTGAESLVGSEAEVVSKLSVGDHAQYMVRCQGELWGARCPDVVQPGETVNIAAVDGIRLVVERRSNDSHHD